MSWLQRYQICRDSTQLKLFWIHASTVQFSSVKSRTALIRNRVFSSGIGPQIYLTEVRRSAPFSRGCHGECLRIMGYPDKPSSPRGSLSIVLSVLAVHMRTSQRPVGQYVCHWSQSNRAGSLWHFVPRDNGQMYEQPTDHIPHESHFEVSVFSWDDEWLSESPSQLLGVSFG